MEEWVSVSNAWFNKYIDSFKELTDNQKLNFKIKKEHSLRVADISLALAEKLEFTDDENQIAFLIGLFHDIGRFRQLIEFDTFNDAKSVDHAEYSVKILQDASFFDKIDLVKKSIIFLAIQNHNKFKIQDDLSKDVLTFAKLIRDADKLDIYRVLAEYYSNRNSVPNHTLTWELPKGTKITSAVAKEVLAGKMVSKKNIVSDIDIKILQMSWVYDLNFRASFEYVLKKRFLENIYNSLPKNDLVIEVYRKIKVFTENQILVKGQG